MKESPKPPRTFLEYDRRSHGSCLLPGKNPTGCADTVSAVSGTRFPPECRFRWDCKRRKRSNAGVPGAKPPAKLTYGLPLPVGKGVGGWGQKRKRTQCKQATKKARPPRGHVYGRDNQRRKRFNAGVPGAKPPAKKTYGLPLPAGKGVGGMGAGKQSEGRVGGRQRKHAPRLKSHPPSCIKPQNML